MLRVAAEAVLVTPPRPTKEMATNGWKDIKWKEPNSYKGGKAQARKHESEGCGFESWCRQSIFSNERSVKEVQSSYHGICQS